ncbi:coiled-coil domain-containing protein 115 [Ambystoma mexicanum]|uniref:coiled-coil domain-containing protein 115 n=1 Tax=Ambystoma mexicanum TaxID=8296 RepID=UPI0037E8EF91
MAGEDLTLADVCEELDRLLLHMMSELESLQSKRQSLNDLVEQGWFSLSQSRYAMGNKGVSSLQYGHQMEPLVRVSTSANEDGSCHFQMVCTESGKSDGPDSPEVPRLEEIGPKDQGLRRRKAPMKTDEPTPPEKLPASEVELASAEKADKIKGADGLVSPQDPLKWFGILVPQSLKHAQNSFRQGVTLASEVAELQSSIEATRTKYQKLLLKKQQLLA